METFDGYLIRSSVWLTGFGLIYLMFLRNERYFTLNRIFLLAGMIASVCFPLIRFHYTIEMPMVEAAEVTASQPEVTEVAPEPLHAPDLLPYFYLSGILYLIFRLLKQTITVVRVIRKSGSVLFNNIRLVRTDRYPAPFSLFSYVFVNPSVSEAEISEIVHHEQEHIRQKHWIDLILFELICALQWFNPAVWLYGRFIRQNHEYLADESALKRSQYPGKYRAALLNQMFGAPVIQLSNSFNYSLNKKRFIMMKQTISSPVRKLRLLWILPLMAGVFYAFSSPEYRFVQTEKTTKNDNFSSLHPEKNVFSGDDSGFKSQIKASVTQSDPNQTRQIFPKTMKGKVTDANGNPLEGASVVVSGTTLGTTTDPEGNFKIEMTDSSPVLISYVGFKTAKVTPDFKNPVSIKLTPETIGIESVVVVSYAKSKSPSESSGTTVIKDNEVFTIVEQMPEFPGGATALRRFIAEQIRYPRIAAEDKAQGKVFVNFVVNREGYVWNAKIVKSVHPALDQEAIRVIYSLPRWEPGVQHGKAVDVTYTIPIDFIIQ